MQVQSHSYLPKFGLGYVLKGGINGAEGTDAQNDVLDHPSLREAIRNTANRSFATDGSDAKITIMLPPEHPRLKERIPKIIAILKGLGVPFEIDETRSDPGTSCTLVG